METVYFDNNIPRMLALNVLSRFTDEAAYWRFSPVRHTDVDEPEIPNPRWLKVKNRACGVCGSDINFVFADKGARTFLAALPGIPRKYLGHELVGEVVEVGADVACFEAGDRVTLRIDWPSCFQMEIEPPCPRCAAGSYMLCENLGKKELALTDNGGGFSPFMVVHRTQPFKVPPGLSDDEAILMEPLACAVHGVYKRVPGPGERVLVIGCGPIGLLTIAAVKALQPDALVHCVARYPFQAEMAVRMGADEVIADDECIYESAAEATDARVCTGLLKNRILLGGFDIILDSIGKDSTVQDSLRLLRGGGTLVIVGINFKPGRLDYSPVWHQELHLTGINCHAIEPDGRNSFEAAAGLLLENRIDVSGMITHRYPLARFREAVETLQDKGRRGAIKVLIEHQAGWQSRASSSR